MVGETSAVRRWPRIWIIWRTGALISFTIAETKSAFSR